MAREVHRGHRVATHRVGDRRSYGGQQFAKWMVEGDRQRLWHAELQRVQGGSL